MMSWFGDARTTRERKIKAYEILNTQDCSHIAIGVSIFS